MGDHDAVEVDDDLGGDVGSTTEGDEGDAWYVVFDGTANVLKDLGSISTRIAALGPGACFGEMAILDGMARSASVVAEGPLTVFRFRRERFDGLLDQGSLGAYKLVAAMARSLSQRQRILTQQLAALTSGSSETLNQLRISE